MTQVKVNIDGNLHFDFVALGNLLSVEVVEDIKKVIENYNAEIVVKDYGNFMDIYVSYDKYIKIFTYDELNGIRYNTSLDKIQLRNIVDYFGVPD